MAHTRAERFADAARYLVPLVRRFVQLDGARVVEFGAGSGPVAEAFAEQGASVLGLDILDHDVEEGRRLFAVRPELDVELVLGSFEELVARTEAEAGTVDVLLFPAVLEHMTIPERLTALRLAPAVLKPGGVVALFETPNRLLPMDYHTTEDAFFGYLPDELAEMWLPRTPRQFTIDEVMAAEPGPARRLALTRAGRGVSYHELDLAWEEGWVALAGGYEPELLPLRPIHEEERVVAGWIERSAPGVHPAFSRYWIDLVARPFPGPPASRVWRSVPFDAVDQPGVGINRQGTLHLRRAGSAVDVVPDAPFDAIELSLAHIDQDSELEIQAGDERFTLEAPTAESAGDLSQAFRAPVSRVRLTVRSELAVVAHIGVRSIT